MTLLKNPKKLTFFYIITYASIKLILTRYHISLSSGCLGSCFALEVLHESRLSHFTVSSQEVRLDKFDLMCHMPAHRFAKFSF